MALAIASSFQIGAGSVTSWGDTYSCAAGAVLIRVIATDGVGDYVTVSSMSGDGLTWTKRSSSKLNAAYTGAANQFQNLEVWWAYSSAAKTNVTVTTTLALNSSSSHGNTIGLQFEVSGSLSGSAPWDDNAAAEAVATYTNASTLSSSNFGASCTVSQTNDMILGFLIEETSSGSSSIATAGSGFTSINTFNRGNSPNQWHVAAERKAQAASGAASMAWASSGKLTYITVIDALTGTSTGTGGAAVGPATISQPQVVQIQ